MKIIDLTHTIKRKGMMVFPGDPEIALEEALTHEADYCHVDHLDIGSHTGTHIDAPYHFIADGKRITDYPVEKFISEGIAIDLQHKKAGEAILAEDIKSYKDAIKKGDFVVLQTGWYEKFGTEEYLNHPYISKDAASMLVNLGVSIVAVDFLNVDPTLWESWEAHPVLLSHDVLIVENINNSSMLQKGRRYAFSFAPLKLEDADGSPIRAFAAEL